MKKKKILFCNESSLLSTGFSNYGFELLSRLQASNKYEIAELAAFSDGTHPGISSLPWKHFTVKPKDNDEEAMKIYNSKPTFAWGEFKFDEVCLQFKPDIVFDIRDEWNFEFESRSPARQYFNWVISPPVDSAPQKEEWIATFCNADKVVPYTDWGFNVLREEANQKINLFKTASPGVNLDNFKFTNSNEAKQKIGLSPEMFIIGTVMRNQIRKLYPDLIQSFAKFLEVAPENVASRSYLYLHTAYPDVGWDIPCLIKEHGVSHRTMMTYYCLSCREIFPSLFQDGLAICKYCGNNTAILPNIKHGIPHKVLSTVMSIFDCYVQYATNEGFGIPMVEAAACGVPVFAVDYSAMSEVVRNLHGFPVEVKTFFRDQGTMSYRAYPDNDDFIKKLIKFAQMPFSMRARIGAKARKAVEDRYTWEHNFKVWEECFDSIDTSVNKWAFPANYFTPQKIIPKGLSNPQFVRWGFEHVAGRPDLVNTHLALGTLRDLNLGLAFSKLDREQCMNHFINLCNQRNIFEQRRCDENSIYSSL